tara:strand:+ start:1097 stop:2080 length:984 start_codon:yes stop_codon:yes gene_type:complete
MSYVRANTLQTLNGETLFSISGNTVNFPKGYTPSSLIIPTWTNSSRPSSPAIGYIGYNTETVTLEVYYGIDPFDNSDAWGKCDGSLSGGAGLFGVMETLNSQLSSYGYNDVTSIRTVFENEGYVLVATPCYGGMAESQQGTSSPITSRGYFKYNEWDNGNQIELSDGMPNATLDGYPYMIFAGYDGSNYRGIAFMAYRDYTTPTPLKDFWYPMNDRNLYCYVLNADGSTVEDVSGNTSTYYSDGQYPNSNGYNSTSRFASDDGSWGFRIGTQRLDGNGGPYLSQDSSKSYGCENRNSGDTCCPEMFWGPQSNTGTTNYTFFFAVKYV